MDLLAGIRKEGSRGGRGEFKWTEVQNSQHRENYLGHSVMAPVGRWQRGRDLQWYAKGKEGDDLDAREKVQRERQQEIRAIQQAEKEALNGVLGVQTGRSSVPLAESAASGRKRTSDINATVRGRHDDLSLRTSSTLLASKEYKQGQHHQHYQHRYKGSNNDACDDKARTRVNRKRHHSPSSRSRSPRPLFREQKDERRSTSRKRRHRENRIRHD